MWSFLYPIWRSKPLQENLRFVILGYINTSNLKQTWWWRGVIESRGPGKTVKQLVVVAKQGYYYCWYERHRESLQKYNLRVSQTDIYHNHKYWLKTSKLFFELWVDFSISGFSIFVLSMEQHHQHHQLSGLDGAHSVSYGCTVHVSKQQNLRRCLLIGLPLPCIRWQAVTTLLSLHLTASSSIKEELSCVPYLFRPWQSCFSLKRTHVPARGAHQGLAVYGP